MIANHQLVSIQSRHYGRGKEGGGNPRFSLSGGKWARASITRKRRPVSHRIKTDNNNNNINKGIKKNTHQNKNLSFNS